MEKNDKYEYTLVYPFHNITQKSNILIAPNQMNSNIIDNMRANLISKLELLLENIIYFDNSSLFNFV